MKILQSPMELSDRPEHYINYSLILSLQSIMIEEIEIEDDRQGYVHPVDPTQDHNADSHRLLISRGDVDENSDSMVNTFSDATRLQHLQNCLKQFTFIRSNIYVDPKTLPKKKDNLTACRCHDRMKGDILYTNVIYDCREGCLNRQSNIECNNSICSSKESCQNRNYAEYKYAKVYPMPMGEKGWGLCAGQFIPKGKFIIQYVGEAYKASSKYGQNRMKSYIDSSRTYLMYADKKNIIDSTKLGNFARFINHSCDPNCNSQKWQVSNEIHLGIYAKNDIKKGEQLTFDYKLDKDAHVLTKCQCGAFLCKKYIGVRIQGLTQEKTNDYVNSLVCQICKILKEDDYTEVILCDQCNKGFHRSCQPMNQIQSGSFCNFCIGTIGEKRCYQKREDLKAFLQNKREIEGNESLKKQIGESFNFSYKLEMCDYYKLCAFIKETEKKVTDKMLGESQQEREKSMQSYLEIYLKDMQNQIESSIRRQNNQVDNPQKENYRRMDIDEDTNKIDQMKMEQMSKSIDDGVQELTKQAIEKLRIYDQKFKEDLQNLYISYKENKNQRQKHKKEWIFLLSVLENNIILKQYQTDFRKMGVQIGKKYKSCNFADCFLPKIQVKVFGKQEQISIFEQIVEQIHKTTIKLSSEKGYTQASMPIPAIFLTKLLGRGCIGLQLVEKATHVAIYYFYKYINHKCYPLETTCNLLIKGSTQNIHKAYKTIKEILSTFEIKRLFFNDRFIDEFQSKLFQFKINSRMAEIRVGSMPLIEKWKNPYTSCIIREKQIVIIGTKAEIQVTYREILSLHQQYCLQNQVNNQTNTAIMQNYVINLDEHYGNRITNDLRFISNEIMDYQKVRQMINKYFKNQFQNMQNSILTGKTSYMLTWDTWNIDDCYRIIDQKWNSVRQYLINDHETLLYAFFIFKDKIISKLHQQSSPLLLFLLKAIRTKLDKIMTVSQKQIAKAKKPNLPENPNISLIQISSAEKKPHGFCDFDRKDWHRFNEYR